MREFNDSATRAIKRLYAGPKREKGMYHDHDHDIDSDESSDSGDEGTENLDESTGPNETVFLVYLYVLLLGLGHELMIVSSLLSRNLAGKSCSYWIPLRR